MPAVLPEKGDQQNSRDKTADMGGVGNTARVGTDGKEGLADDLQTDPKDQKKPGREINDG